MAVVAPEATLEFSRPAGDTLVLRLSGAWTIHERLPSVDDVERELEAGGAVRRLLFDTECLAAWDSALLTFLLRVAAQADGRGVAACRGGLPEGVRRLLALAMAVPERRDPGTAAARLSWLARVGLATLEGVRDARVTLTFVGAVSIAFARSLLGTMQVNEEIDAVTTLGISPIEFLVLPRMLALAVMMPLLALYADLLGLLGGMAVGVGMLDLGVVEYYLRTIGAIGLDDCVAGLIKASVFGVLIAMAGCLRGIQCGRRDRKSTRLN